MQRGAYLANTEGVEVNAKWGGARGFFSGQGLVLLRATGNGDVFFSTYGAMLEMDVCEQGLIVDPPTWPRSRTRSTTRSRCCRA